MRQETFEYAFRATSAHENQIHKMRSIIGIVGTPEIKIQSQLIKELFCLTLYDLLIMKF